MKTKEELLNVFTGTKVPLNTNTEYVQMYSKKEVECIIDQLLENIEGELTHHILFTKFRVLASDPTIEQRERTAVNCVQIAQSYADQAVQRRDEEIKEYVRGKMFRDEVAEIRKLINTELRWVIQYISASSPSIEPSLPKEPSIPETKLNEFKTLIIPELSRKGLEERCIEMYEKIEAMKWVLDMVDAYKKVLQKVLQKVFTEELNIHNRKEETK